MSKLELMNEATKHISYPEDQQSNKFFISSDEDVDVHCNVFDQSCVEYYKTAESGDFDIYFDDELYKPPQIILDLETQQPAKL